MNNWIALTREIDALYWKEGIIVQSRAGKLIWESLRVRSKIKKRAEDIQDWITPDDIQAGIAEFSNMVEFFKAFAEDMIRQRIINTDWNIIGKPNNENGGIGFVFDWVVFEFDKTESTGLYINARITPQGGDQRIYLAENPSSLIVLRKIFDFIDNTPECIAFEKINSNQKEFHDA